MNCMLSPVHCIYAQLFMGERWEQRDKFVLTFTFAYRYPMKRGINRHSLYDLFLTKNYRIRRDIIKNTTNCVRRNFINVTAPTIYAWSKISTWDSAWKSPSARENYENDCNNEGRFKPILVSVIFGILKAPPLTKSLPERLVTDSYSRLM